MSIRVELRPTAGDWSFFLVPAAVGLGWSIVEVTVGPDLPLAPVIVAGPGLLLASALSKRRRAEALVAAGDRFVAPPPHPTPAAAAGYLTLGLPLAAATPAGAWWLIAVLLAVALGGLARWLPPLLGVAPVTLTASGVTSRRWTGSAVVPWPAADLAWLDDDLYKAVKLRILRPELVPRSGLRRGARTAVTVAVKADTATDLAFLVDVLNHYLQHAEWRPRIGRPDEHHRLFELLRPPPTTPATGRPTPGDTTTLRDNG